LLNGASQTVALVLKLEVLPYGYVAIYDTHLPLVMRLEY
jgi:hypothetical protein